MSADCRRTDSRRRSARAAATRPGAALLLDQTALNGIDFVEFEIWPAASPCCTCTSCTTCRPATTVCRPIRRRSGSTAARGSSASRSISAAASATDPKVLDVDVDQQGDFSAVSALDRLEAR